MPPGERLRRWSDAACRWLHATDSQDLGAQRLGHAIGVGIGPRHAHVPLAKGKLILRPHR